MGEYRRLKMPLGTVLIRFTGGDDGRDYKAVRCDIFFLFTTSILQ